MIEAPYVLSNGPEFDLDSAVTIEPFAAPQSEADVQPLASRQGRGWSATVESTDWPLSHSAQQILALIHARANAGFENVVVFNLTSDLGQSKFYYNTTTGAWREALAQS